MQELQLTAYQFVITEWQREDEDFFGLYLVMRNDQIGHLIRAFRATDYRG